MPRRPRLDAPGIWHHVGNRGIAHRTVFENRADLRYFLSAVARMVRRGLIEVACYSVLSTHFHLLVRSPAGGLSKAMAWIESRHVRRFNRLRFRDGPLFRGRFWSKRVLNDAYLGVLVRYIDWNAVHARLAKRPEDYPYGSAFHFARSDGPLWLARATLEDFAKENSASAEFSFSSYRRTFGDDLSERSRATVARDLASPNPVAGSFFDFVGDAPGRVKEELLRNSSRSDGAATLANSVEPAVLLEVIANSERANPASGRPCGRGRLEPWSRLRAGLLRAIAGVTLREIAERMRISLALADKRAREHEQLLAEDAGYVRIATAIVEAALRATWG